MMDDGFKTMLTGDVGERAAALAPYAVSDLVPEVDLARLERTASWSPRTHYASGSSS
jgi:hypothetical protein